MGRRKKLRERSRGELLDMLYTLADESSKNLYADVYDKNGERCGSRYDTSAAGIVLKSVELSAKLSGFTKEESIDDNELRVVFEGGADKLAG